MATKEGTLISDKHVVIEPSKRAEFVAEGVVREWQGPPFDKKPIEVWVNVFDPKKNGHELLVVRSAFHRSLWKRYMARRMPKYTSFSSQRRRG